MLTLPGRKMPPPARSGSWRARAFAAALVIAALVCPAVAHSEVFRPGYVDPRPILAAATRAVLGALRASRPWERTRGDVGTLAGRAD